MTWFYGDPGHGGSLVDAMSCFGCKWPLRNAIVTKDQWFDGAYKMKLYLEDLFAVLLVASKKYYYYIIYHIYPIDSCRKKHISVDQYGEFTTKVAMDSNDSGLLNLNFDDIEETCNIPLDIGYMFEDSHDESNGDHEKEEGIISSDTIFSMIYPDTFVGIQSTPSSLESLYVVKVISKGVANENITDKFGYTVLTIEKYVSGYYLNRVSEGKSCIKFSLPKKSSVVYIQVKETFSIDIKISPSVNDIKEFHAINQLKMHKS